MKPRALTAPRKRAPRSSPAIKLTRAQEEALVRVRDRGPYAWCAGVGRAGGAVARLFERLADQGLVSRAPHKITKAGRALVQHIEVRR